MESAHSGCYNLTIRANLVFTAALVGLAARALSSALAHFA